MNSGGDYDNENGNEKNGGNGGLNPTLPAVDDVQRVDAEPVDAGPHYRYGRAAPHFHQAAGGGSSYGASIPFLKPPVLTTWICLLLAWLFLGSKIPFTVFLGVPFALAALFLSTICLSRGGLITGLLVMILGSVGSIVVYLFGLFRFLIRL